MAECINCKQSIYIGSRLPEDSYVILDGMYRHVNCPRTTPSNDSPVARGDCHWCGARVPATNLNKFYCSDSCGVNMQEYKADKKPIPEEDEDWWVQL